MTTAIDHPTDRAAWGRRLAAYLSERFPPMGNGLLILSFYSSNQFLAHALNHPGRPMTYDWSSIAGIITMLGFFLHMRIFDDHKDYASDQKYFPERVLQRGGVTLRELKVLGTLVIGTELTLAAVYGPAALLAWGVAFGFSILMLKEFFLRQWLKQRFLLYASLHMLIMPLLAMIVWSFATGQFFWQLSPWYGLYTIVGYLLAFNWEISRKIRVPADEREGLDSYSRLFGTVGAAYWVLVIRALDTLLMAMIACHLGLSVWFYGVLVLLFLVCLIGFAEHRWRPSTRSARRLSVYAGLYIIAFDFALAVELIRLFGITWSGA